MSERKLSRRHFLKVSAVGGVGLALAACAVPASSPAASSQGAASGQATAAPAAENVTIRFMSRAGADNIPNAQKVLDGDFRAANPNIQVSIEPAPDGWEQKLLAQMVAGTAVDLFQAWGNIFYNWTERNLILDVQPFVDRDLTDAQIQDYTKFQWDGLVIRGIRAGMPKYINLMTVTVNKDLFEKYNVDLPPEDGKWNHDDYAAMAKKLTEAAKKAGDENRWGGWYPAWSWDRFWYRVDMFGGQVVDQKYGTKCMLDTEKSQAGLQWSYDMIWKNNWFAQPSQVEDKWFNDIMAPQFVCFAESGTYPMNTDRAYNGAFKWDMRHVPCWPHGHP